MFIVCLQIMESEYRDLVDEVLKKIGRNILLFQQIEKGLKLLLPFIVHPNSIANNIDDFRKQRESVKSQTLGSLINTFVKSVDYDIDYFAENLKKIVDERNKLVHHFDVNILSTKEGCKTCIARLEAQYQEAISFYKSIELFVFTLLMLLREH